MWNRYVLNIKKEKALFFLDAICDYGVDPNYIQVVPTGSMLVVSFECTDEKYSYLIKKGIFNYT